MASKPQVPSNNCLIYGEVSGDIKKKACEKMKSRWDIYPRDCDLIAAKEARPSDHQMRSKEEIISVRKSLQCGLMSQFMNSTLNLRRVHITLANKRDRLVPVSNSIHDVNAFSSLL